MRAQYVVTDKHVARGRPSPPRTTPTTVMITWEQNILHAINRGTMFGGVSSALGEVLRGVPLGRANGQVVWSGVRLVCDSGSCAVRGALARRDAAPPAATRWAAD